MSEEKKSVFKSADKIKIWKEIWQTNPDKTKKFTKSGGFTGTAINPTYIKERLTELFGPVGLGWGYKVVDEEMVKGHKFEDGQVLVHKVLIEFWYRFGEMKSEPIQAFGQTTFVGKYSRGWFTDEDAPKKSLTDALGKAVSDLGMCADIYMGLYDDNKYIAEVKEKFLHEEKPKAKATGKEGVKGPASSSPPSVDKATLEDRRAILEHMKKWDVTESEMVQLMKDNNCESTKEILVTDLDFYMAEIERIGQEKIFEVTQ